MNGEDRIRWTPILVVGVLVGALLVLLSNHRHHASRRDHQGVIVARYSTGGKPVSFSGTDPIHKIQHVVIIMQENRSFDSYLGTYPGANGIPMREGRPLVCIPNPKRGHCQAPYHDSSVVNAGGPHGRQAGVADLHGGRMDGFVAVAERRKTGCTGAVAQNDPACAATTPLHHCWSDIAV